MLAPMKRFTTFFPATLARIQAGTQVRLLDKNVKKQGSFDLKTTNGMVKPIPSTQKTWTYPNGCSLRSPYSTTFQDVAENFYGKDVNIFIIDKGTPVPEDLILLLERGDHFSLQCAKPMLLAELNAEITQFLARNATRMSKDEYQEQYQAGEDNDSLDIKSLKEN